MQQKFGWGLVLALIGLISLNGFVMGGQSTAGSVAEINGSDTAWMLGASGLVLLMTPGLAFFYAGMVNAKNVVSTLFQSFAAMGVVSVVWLICGFGLAFGPSIGGIIGDPRAYFMFQDVGPQPSPLLGTTIPFVLFALFQLKFAIITPALITGAFAERVRFAPFLLFVTLWSVCVYAPLAHMTWHPDGYFFKMGILDFAGGTVVHISAGIAALAGAIFFGPRDVHRRGLETAPSNVPFVLLGTGLLWFGWFGFNAGSSLAANGTGALAFLNTHMASAVAFLVWMCLDGLWGKKVSAVGGCIGAVVGLVAITPAAGFVTVSGSVLIGFVASMVSNTLVHFKHKLPFDDALDVFACHGVGGIVGMILTAVLAFQNGGVISGSSTLLGSHFIGLLITVPFVFCASYALYWVVNVISPLRVSAAEEQVGLDLSQHGEIAMVPPVAAFPLIVDEDSHNGSIDHGSPTAQNGAIQHHDHPHGPM